MRDLMSNLPKWIKVLPTLAGLLLVGGSLFAEKPMGPPALADIRIGIGEEEFVRYVQDKYDTKLRIDDNGYKYTCSLPDPMGFLRAEVFQGKVFRIELSTEIDHKILRESIEMKYGKRSTVKNDHHYWIIAEGRYRLTLHNDSVTLENLEIWTGIQEKSATDILGDLEP
ncbi:MAG TPA: hypothetical protein DEA96_02195 [Leptospiraceae bacterium]|nr:hypothetical protein [Spirochaetaceae bacterium]HBS03746.1 hypothetical protein [Leptospiraceae bacterium]|tara:strand:- start:28599 stop:29105 length:507 start_codon:yes stop_codon:yes gene_type:complete